MGIAAGLATLLVAILSAGTASASPLVLRCDGVAGAISPYDAEPVSARTQRYYRIEPQRFSRLLPSDVVWSGNYCSTKDATCSADETAFNANWKDRSSVVTVLINRKTGRVLDKTVFGGAGTIEFIGDCVQSVDPAPSDGPSKF